MKLGLLARRLLAKTLEWVAGWLPVRKREKGDLSAPGPDQPQGAEDAIPEHWRRLRQGPPEHWLALLRKHGVGLDSGWTDIKLGRQRKIPSHRHQAADGAPPARPDPDLAPPRLVHPLPDHPALSFGGVGSAPPRTAPRFSAVTVPDRAGIDDPERPPRTRFESARPPRFSRVTEPSGETERPAVRPGGKPQPEPAVEEPPRPSRPLRPAAPVFPQLRPTANEPVKSAPKKLKKNVSRRENPPPPTPSAPPTPQHLDRSVDSSPPAMTWPSPRRKPSFGTPFLWGQDRPRPEGPTPGPTPAAPSRQSEHALRFPEPAAREPSPQLGFRPNPTPEWPALLQPLPEEREMVVDEYWRARSRLERLKKEQRG